MRMGGRLALCEGPGQALAAPGAINHPALDPFTLVHASVGLLGAALGLRLATTVLLAITWEIAEHLLKDCVPGAFVFPDQDTVRNAVGDVLATVAGWFLFQRARRRAVGEAS